MGASKRNPTTATVAGAGRFPKEVVAQAEADRGLHFAVAIERLRGWPVHGTFVGEEIVRFQSESGGDVVFDAHGIFSSMRFGQTVISFIVLARRDWPEDAIRGGQMRIGTRCIGEEGLEEAGATIDESAVARFVGWIEANPVYLGYVGERPYPRHPANVVARYSWSGCVAFAEALSRVTGLPAVTMLPEQIKSGHEITKAKLHAVVLHPDGSVEDVWGRQPARLVADRYAMARWRFDAEAHQDMMAEAFRERPTASDDVAVAEALIRSVGTRSSSE